MHAHPWDYWVVILIAGMSKVDIAVFTFNQCELIFQFVEILRMSRRFAFDPAKSTGFCLGDVW